jgi:hypothetical protein
MANQGVVCWSVGVLGGGSSLVAALRVWPATIRKITTFLPGSQRRRRPLDMNDAVPVILIGPIFLGFSFLAYWTSLKFVTLAVALVLITSSFSICWKRLPGRAVKQLRSWRILENFCLAPTPTDGIARTTWGRHRKSSTSIVRTRSRWMWSTRGAKSLPRICWSFFSSTRLRRAAPKAPDVRNER